MDDGQLISFASWAPDVTPIDTGATPIVQNVVPRADGYGPFPSFAALSTTLGATCRGAFFARNTDGSVTIFAATATNLYQLNATSFGWTNVSLGGGPYTSVPSTDNWQFAQFGSIVIAVQVNVVPQAFTLGSSTAFSALGGSPPQASHIAIISQFILLSGISGTPFRIQWSDLNAPTTWTPGVGFANFIDLPDGGVVHDIRGGDQYGIVFQDTAIRSLTYAPGSPVVFDILRVATQDGVFGQYSSVTAGDQIYFCSPQGFKVIPTGGYPTSIGKEMVDRTFFADIDTGNLQLFIGATDPSSTRVYWMYKSKSGQTGYADKIIMYDWVLKKWSTIVGQALEYVLYMSKPGLTLEGLDAIAPGVITITSAANNGSGNIRLTLSPGSSAGTPPSNTNLQIENSVEIYNASGGVPNGNFPITYIDSTHVDLPTQAYTSTGTGSIGGSLDQLPFSLDSVSSSPLLQFAAFNSSNLLGIFSGPALQATIETPTQDLGARYGVLWLRPITDAPVCLGALGTLDTTQSTLTYTTQQSINSLGLIPQRTETRYARAQLQIPSGTTWTYAMGVRVPGTVVTGYR